MLKKILFISHETSRTGAPFVLLYFLQWLKQHHSDIQITVLTLNGGGLTNEFKMVADEYYDLTEITNPKRNIVQRAKTKLYKKLGITYAWPDAKRIFVENLSQQDFDLVYSNTVVSIPIATQIKLQNKDANLLVHVHELESEIERTIGSLEQFLNNIDIVIAASKMVRNNLLFNHSIPANKIEIIYEFTKKLNPEIKIKNEGGIFKVGGSGKFGYRKGTDLFIQTARYLNDHYPQLKIEFTWVGLVPENEKASLELELNKLELNTRINFVGEVENPELYFEKFDVFLMTSREDPFPLVCIEAGMLGIPIICFDKATGISEIIKDKGGYIVPYLNIEAMAEKVIFYIKNPKIYIEHGQFNKNEFSKFTAEEKGEEIYKLLEKSIIK